MRRSGSPGWAIKSQRRLAKDLGISDVSLRRWVREEQAAGGERPGWLSNDEREELGRLRDENASGGPGHSSVAATLSPVAAQELEGRLVECVRVLVEASVG